MSDEANEEDDETIVLFQNHQWAVTDYGMETLEQPEPKYHFNAERLLETAGAGGGELYD
jgi:hypothetical protein